MASYVQVVFENDAKIKSNETVSQFVEQSSGSFTTLVVDGELTVAVKSVKENKQSYDKVRMIAGSVSRELGNCKVEKALVDGARLTEAFSKLEADTVITAFSEGWQLGSYQFETYKSEKKSFKTALEIEGDDFNSAFEAGKVRADAVAFSRDLMNEPPNGLNPATYPVILQKEFQDSTVEVTVFDKDEIEKRQMNGVLTVCRGSKHDPAFVELTYRGDQSKPLVALVGKGVTFDTGGITLKRGKDLSNMRFDMGGSAAVAGAMKLLADSEAKVNITALIPIVENVPDSNAVIPGEVINYKNGLNVQVGNTDAEGRLILADGLIRAQELKADYIVDIATLTGAIIGALGSKLAGVFGDEELSTVMREVGQENGDFNWPMPLIDAYESYIKSDYADFNNTSGKPEAGSIVAALFLRKFVTDPGKWLHVDMAGVMSSEENGYYSKAGTGYGARLLADFTERISQ
ncbi:M17 family metallopeptidase [Virgibacillus kekensis]|uniref:Probable cytosol aminopeptidase n=1 Tax=Virgibacillus kekensis TaxID=202261 RepID=A0ABV9DFZ9_9BACI